MRLHTTSLAGTFHVKKAKLAATPNLLYTFLRFPSFLHPHKLVFILSPRVYKNSNSRKQMSSSLIDKRTCPFLAKCYDMVDDPSTDPIISWGSMDTSFVISDVIALEQQLLPKYYKHRNFSSFIRQLNLYGFKKFDPDRWEFTNNGFIKGQKHVLRNIARRKTSQGNFQQNQSQEKIISRECGSSQSNCQQSPSKEYNNSTARKSSQGHCQQNLPQESNFSTRRKSLQGNIGQNESQESNPSTRRKFSQGSSEQKPSQESNTFTRRKPFQDSSRPNQAEENKSSAGACVEVGTFGLWDEVEILKKGKNVVMQELAKLKHHQQVADGKLHLLGQRLEGMEISQQQMLSFLAMVVQSPGFLVQLLQQNDSSWGISEASRKRTYIALEQGTECNEPLVSDGQIVRYQPLNNETPMSLLPAPSNWDEYQQFDPSGNELDDFFRYIDPMSSGHEMAVSMEDSAHGEDEDVGRTYIPGSLEYDMLEKLLLASPPPENIETIKSNKAGSVENNVDMEFTNNNTLGEPSQTLDSLTEELRLLVSETNDA